MKKRTVVAAAFAACLAMCAAVWPQNEPAEGMTTLPIPPAVTAAHPEVPEIPAIEERIMPEEEKDDMQPDPVDEIAPAPEPPQPTTPPDKENSTVLEQEPEVTPTPPDCAPDNMVYVPGFGWLENQGPNHAEYAEDMYENGNKLGSMG